MSSSRNNSLILAAAAVVESVWLYALTAVFSLALALDGSPVSWIAVVALMLASFLTAWALSSVIMPAWIPYAVQLAVGLAAVYGALATQLAADGALDMGWFGAMAADGAESEYIRAATLGIFACVLFWWRGGGIASTEAPAERLSFSFKTGLIALSFAAVVDTLHPADLGVFPLIFIFFAVGLAGLSAGHILQSANRPITQQAWLKVIGGAVGAVVGAGLLVSLLQRGALEFIARPLAWMADGLVTVILYVVLLPLIFIFSLLATGLLEILRRFASEQPERETPESVGGFQDMMRGLREQAESNDPSIWVDMLGWAALGVIAIVLLAFLARAFRRRIRWRRVDQEGERETVSEDVDPALDIARLLMGLVPDRLRRRKAGRGLRLPDDERGVVEVFRLYFGMLNAAAAKGLPRAENETPTEYQATLARAFPLSLVRAATAAFNRACYGREPTSAERIAEMRREMERGGE